MKEHLAASIFMREVLIQALPKSRKRHYRKSVDAAIAVKSPSAEAAMQGKRERTRGFTTEARRLTEIIHREKRRHN
jgi:hypothetical protein